MENTQEVLLQRVLAAKPVLAKIVRTRLYPTEMFIAVTLALEPEGRISHELLLRHVARTLQIPEREVDRAIDELCAQRVMERRDFDGYKCTCQILPVE